MKTSFLLALCLCGAALAAAETPPPAMTARRLAEQFLSTDPTLYKPRGYSGGKAYGGGQLVHYATVSLWVNALECAHRMGDTNLVARLAAAFEPYYGEKKSVMNDDRHVDLSIVGAVPLEIAVLTGDVCAGTGWRNSRAHYMGRPRVNGDPHGQAPLLWLCAALLAAR